MDPPSICQVLMKAETAEILSLGNLKGIFLSTALAKYAGKGLIIKTILINLKVNE